MCILVSRSPSFPFSYCFAPSPLFISLQLCYSLSLFLPCSVIFPSALSLSPSPCPSLSPTHSVRFCSVGQHFPPRGGRGRPRLEYPRVRPRDRSGNLRKSTGYQVLMTTLLTTTSLIDPSPVVGQLGYPLPSVPGPGFPRFDPLPFYPFCDLLLFYATGGEEEAAYPRPVPSW